MGIKTMSSHISGTSQQSHVQKPVLRRHNPWFGLTLDQVENQLGDLGKPLGSMNVDELLNNVLIAEARNSSTVNPSNNSPAATLQRQASLSLVKAFRGRTVNDVWRDIERGYRMRSGEGMSSEERLLTLGETTLEDFLVKASMYVSESSSLGHAMSLDSALMNSQNFSPQVRNGEGMSSEERQLTLGETTLEDFLVKAESSSLGHAMSLDSALMNSQNFSPQVKLSPSPSIDELSDTSMLGRKRNSGDIEKAVERRLRRKIKNRESAARSRARKQAYHNELVSKVSQLEMENIKLRKKKELVQMLSTDISEPRYQLRRTSSL